MNADENSERNIVKRHYCFNCKIFEHKDTLLHPNSLAITIENPWNALAIGALDNQYHERVRK